MKVLLVFTNSSVRDKRTDPDHLKSIIAKAAGEKQAGMEIFITFARSISFFISNEQVRIRDNLNHMNLEEYDFVYFRKAGAAMQQMQVCAHYLHDRGIPFFDSELLKANSRNKLTQMYLMQKKNISIPKTLFCRNNRRLLRLVEKRYAEHFEFPLIAKAVGGSRGDSNYLVNNIAELSKVLSDEKPHFIIQEFIPNDGDFRFFVAGGVLRGVISRQGDGTSHLNNTSTGGTATLVEMDNFSDVVRSESVYASQLFGRDCAGVDIMFDKRTNKHYFLEVNRAPQIDGSSFEEEKGRWMVDAIQDAVTNYQPETRPFSWNKKPVIGRFESVFVLGQNEQEPQKIIAKIDTGADSSSIHCTDIVISGSGLSCSIGNNKYNFDKYYKKVVKSSTGHALERKLVELPIQIGEKDYLMKVTLNDRSSMKHDMLIGRRFIKANHFMVDVSWRYVLSGKKSTRREKL